MGRGENGEGQTRFEEVYLGCRVGIAGGWLGVWFGLGGG